PRRSASRASPRSTPTPSTSSSRTRKASCSRSEQPTRHMTTPPSAPSASATPHGRAGRNLPPAIGSAVVLLGAVAASLLLYKSAFMLIVAAAVVVALWELHRGLSARDIDIPEQPLMLGGVVMVVVAYLW